MMKLSDGGGTPVFQWTFRNGQQPDGVELFLKKIGGGESLSDGDD